MSRAVLGAAVLAALTLGAAAPALAAEVSGTVTEITYDAAAGESNGLRLTRTGDTVRFDDDVAVTTSNPACTADGGDVTCTAPAPDLTLLLGDRDDTLVVTAPVEADTDLQAQGGEGDDRLAGGDDPAELFGDAGDDLLTGGLAGDLLSGEDGDDELLGGGGRDDLLGGAGTDRASGGTGGDFFLGGAGDDTLDGGAGEDSFFGDAGTDTISGGTGVDRVTYFTGDAAATPPVAPVPVSVSLDGVADDGPSGEDDDVDVEDVSTAEDTSDAGIADDTLIGDAQANELFTDSGDDTVDGGPGNDTIGTGVGDDTIRARDGFQDRVLCGPGTDSVQTDSFDQVGDDCERIDGQAAGVYATEDRPPAVAFAAPASGTRLPTAAPTTVTVNATDDRAVQQVVLFDDGRPVGTDAAAPYQFAYQPRGGDVGSNTLTAVAIDSSGQTASGFLTVDVDRFQPRGVTSRTTPSRDTTAPYRFVTTGRVDLPPIVTRAQGCSGVVSVQVKRGSSTISTRRVQLRATCTWSSTVVFRDRSRLGRGTLKVTARFLGNEVLSRRTAPSRTVRTR